MKRIKEDVAYGIYDRPGPQFSDEESVDFEAPIVLEPQTSVQLSVDRPPVDDEDFEPVSISQLALSASEIAKLVPNDQVGFFYKGLHRLLDKATDRTATLKDTTVKENRLRKKINKTILEIIAPDEADDFGEWRYGDEERPAEEIEYDPEQTAPEGMTLDDLAVVFGKKGASAIKQWLRTISDKLQFAALNVTTEQLDELSNFAVDEYVRAMDDADLLDPGDAKEMLASPRAVRSLPSFQYFFATSFFLPVYRELERENNRAIKAEIESQGFPPEIQDTVFNQATGRAELKMSTVRSRLAKAGFDGVQTREIEDRVRRSMPVLKDIAQKQTKDFPGIARSKWESLSRGKKADLLRNSLKQTLVDQQTGIA